MEEDEFSEVDIAEEYDNDGLEVVSHIEKPKSKENCFIFERQKPISEEERPCPTCGHSFTTYKSLRREHGEQVPVHRCLCGSTRSCIECIWCREEIPLKMTQFQCKCETKKGSPCTCGNSAKLVCKCM